MSEEQPAMFGLGKQSDWEPRGERLVRGLYRLYKRKDVRAADKELLVDVMNEVMWDDAIHVAAPWEPRSSLCGHWERNLVRLDEPRPDGMSGCWTCLMAAEWLDQNLQKADAILPA